MYVLATSGVEWGTAVGPGADGARGARSAAGEGPAELLSALDVQDLAVFQQQARAFGALRVQVICAKHGVLIEHPQIFAVSGAAVEHSRHEPQAAPRLDSRARRRALAELLPDRSHERSGQLFARCA